MESLTKERYLAQTVREDLKTKLVFIGGPRQVGKTTLALHLLGTATGQAPTPRHPAYRNWDIAIHRPEIMAADLSPQAPFMVFDEIHKYARWRSLMKGFFDRFHPDHHALVIGSARLDYYRKGGDSLQGRYHYHRLHPYSLGELTGRAGRREALDLLLRFGGFPEPLARQSERALRRWQRERIQRVLDIDLRDLERVQEVSLLELLIEALPTRVGSPLSLRSLSEDLQVNHGSVRRWLDILERLYVTFRIAPYGAPRIRAVKQEQKLYLWDWSQVPDEGPRFENLVASNLLKYCHFQEDSEGFRMDLRYLRDIDKREVDFVVLQDRKPLFAVECKTGERGISPAVRYFKERTPIPAWYQAHRGSRDYGDARADVRVLPLTTLVEELQLP